jgi:hypothetical protein
MELLSWLKLQADRVLAVAAALAGVALLLVGWVGVSSTEFVAEQVPYALSGGIGGLMLLMVGVSLWLSADLSDEWSVLDRLEQSQTEDRAERAALEDRLQLLESRLASADSVLAAPGSERPNGRTAGRRASRAEAVR